MSFEPMNELRGNRWCKCFQIAGHLIPNDIQLEAIFSHFMIRNGVIGLYSLMLGLVHIQNLRNIFIQDSIIIVLDGHSTSEKDNHPV